MKLHIGGTQVKEGWAILNIIDGPGVDYVGSITDLSRFGDQTFDVVYASHVFEHVPQSQIIETLKGVLRILKENGEFYISVPDMDVLCHLFINPSAPLNVKHHVLRMIYGGQTNQHDYHYFGYNEKLLREYLTHVGFRDIRRVDEFRIFNDTSSYKPYGVPISLNVIARK